VRFVDSHIHVCEYADPAKELSYSRSTDTLLVSSGVDRESSERTLSLATGSGGHILGFVGVHPSEAEKEVDLDWVGDALSKATGLGEVGLDPKYSSAEKGSVQLEVFVSQLTAAGKAGKPVQVHSRGAESLCLETLEGFNLKGGVLLHWFQEEDKVKPAADRGYYFSFGPALLTSKKLQRIASRLSLSQVLTETDGPVEFKGLGNGQGPTLIPSVLFKLALLFGMRYEEMRQAVVINSMSFLGLAGKG